MASAPIESNAPDPPIIVPKRKGIMGAVIALGEDDGDEISARLDSGRFFNLVMVGDPSKSSTEGAQTGPLPGKKTPYKPDVPVEICTTPRATFTENPAIIMPQIRCNLANRSVK
jgi:hypothetical protein